MCICRLLCGDCYPSEHCRLHQYCGSGILSWLRIITGNIYFCLDLKVCIKWETHRCHSTHIDRGQGMTFDSYFFASFMNSGDWINFAYFYMLIHVAGPIENISIKYHLTRNMLLQKIKYTHIKCVFNFQFVNTKCSNDIFIYL